MNGLKVFVSVAPDYHGLPKVLADLRSLDYDAFTRVDGVRPEDCDVFLGFIRPKQGSGLERGKKSITYQEFELAIRLEKPCFFMTDYRVAFADDYCEKFAETYGLDKDECLFDLNIVKRESVELYRLAKQYDKCKAYGGNLVFKNLNEILSLMGDKFGNPQRIKKIIEQWTR